MASLFKYYLDFGSGFTEVNPVNNDLEWINMYDINPVITRIKLEGAISFVGSEYDSIITYRDAGNNYIDFRLQQFDSTWQTIFEGNTDLRKAYDENRKKITLSKFNNVDDYYDNFMSNYNIRYGLKDLSLTEYNIVNPSSTSVTIDAAKVAGTGLTPANYKLAYDINGFPVLNPTITDPRWAYFLFRSTDAGGHNFETMSFDYPAGFSTYTEIRMLVSGKYVARWVKLPPSIGATETLTWYLIQRFNRFPDIINALVGIASSTITFTEATAVSYTGQSYLGTPYSYFTFANYQLGEVADVASQGFKGSDISLKYCLDIMANAFNLWWYFDSTALKFKHASEISTTGSLDLSAETEHLRQLDYIYDDMPDIENFFTNDTQEVWNDPTPGDNPMGRVQIYYRTTNNILANPIKSDINIDIFTNVSAMAAGLTPADKNNFALIETTNNTSSPRVMYGTATTLNSRLWMSNLFGHLNKWRFSDTAAFAGRFKIAYVVLADMESRPLLELPPINYKIDLLTGFSMDQAIVTAAGTGRIKKVSQKLNSGVAQIYVEI